MSPDWELNLRGYLRLEVSVSNRLVTLEAHVYVLSNDPAHGLVV